MNLTLLRFGQEGTKKRVIGIRPAGVEQIRWKNALDTLSRWKQNAEVLPPDFPLDQRVADATARAG